MHTAPPPGRWTWDQAGRVLFADQLEAITYARQLSETQRGRYAVRPLVRTPVPGYCWLVTPAHVERPAETEAELLEVHPGAIAHENHVPGCGTLGCAC